MPKCPQCGKPLREFSRRCPSCQADLDLLVDYVSNLQGGLERAEAYTREGELGKAFWAYLQVLETDPDNTVARRQIGQVVTAVRQFDRVTPGLCWLSGADEPGGFQLWLFLGLATILIVLAFSIGYILGYGLPSSANNDEAGKPGPPPANNRMGN